MKLKYTMVSRGQLFYQRRYPKRLRGHPQVDKPLYRKALGVREGDLEEVKLQAWKHADRAFADWVDYLSLANTDALEQRRKQEMADALIETKGLEAGMLAPDPTCTKEQNQALFDDAYEVVERADVVGDLIVRGHSEASKELSLNEEVQSIVWKKLTEPKTASLSAVMLSDCWLPYVKFKSIDVATREGKRQQGRWYQFLSLAGDGILTQDAIHRALDLYVEEREGKVKGSSIAREVNSIMAVVRYTVKKQRLPIVITKPVIRGAGENAERYVLTESEQQRLIQVVQSPDQPGYAAWKEAVFLLMIQSGCITTELQRLKTDNVHLDKPVPYISIAGQKTKTEARQRIIPMVLEVERLKTLLSELGDESGYALGGHFARLDDSNISHQLKTVLQRINPEATAYSLRHTMKNNALGAGVDTGTLALIGGWSTSLAINPIQQQYGSGGRIHETTLRRLQSAMLDINHHLLNAGGTNVVPMRA